MTSFIFRLAAGCLVLGCLLAGTARAQETGRHPDVTAAGAANAGTRPADTAARASGETARLPSDQTTHHTLDLPGRILHIAATAGAIRLNTDEGAPKADVAFIAYQLEGADRLTRPVTFVFNGGPGMASGWLQVGALGPWRISFGDAAAMPSAPPQPMPNADTWLDFTDLVFIDPPGTGYSRVLGHGDDVRRQLWSVDGDIDALADVVRLWLDRSGRIVSPKFIVGESYGGFRGPRLVRSLQSEHGAGITGLVLVSPMLDAHVMSGYDDPLEYASLLPSEAAAARSLNGPVNRAAVADVEQYAKTDYLLDLMRGYQDTAALARMTDRVAALTGIDPGVVARAGGRLDAAMFLHELRRAERLVGSEYDATVMRGDPHPRHPLSQYPDPILQGLNAPVTSAMVEIYNDKLNWRPDGAYRLANYDAARQWNWGRGMGRPESLSFLQADLSLDPRLRVLIACGLFDLVTPYSITVRELDQLPGTDAASRVRLEVYAGGHMFYSVDASRAAFRDAASGLYRAP